VFLVFPQAGPVHAGLADGVAHGHDGGDPDDADHRHRQDQPPGEAGKEEHEEARGRHQDRRPQVGLLGDEPHRQQQQADGDQEVAAADHALAALEVPGQGQGHGDLHELGGLDAGDADVEPAPGALGDVTEQGHGNEQNRIPRA
jgi:hypothetical protein